MNTVHMFVQVLLCRRTVVTPVNNKNVSVETGFSIYEIIIIQNDKIAVVDAKTYPIH